MDAIVTWDAPLSSLRHLTYTAEYRKPSTAFFHTVCKATKEHRCDFGELPSCHGNYQFRVRTELKGNTSSWAETPNFSLKKETVIGPPNVTLVTKGGAIGAVEVFERERVTEQRVKLKPLEPNTRYCIQVQVYIPMPHNNTGQYSKDACVMSTPINTTTDGERRLSEGLVHLTDSHQYTYLASQITSPLQEKYDQISALCEDNPYNVLTDVPEDKLYHVDSGVSVEMPEYYNAVAENANFDMPYKNI
ncbi:unnamed protein product [Coregonus sp. 'balchen']|nr:unnamed protein product [Coregonus sp. 'balchen']